MAKITQKEVEKLINEFNLKFQQAGKSIDIYDINAEIDKSLTYEENFEIIKGKVNNLLPMEHRIKEVKNKLENENEKIELKIQQTIKEQNEKVKEQYQKERDEELEKIIHNRNSNLNKIYESVYDDLEISFKSPNIKGIILLGNAGVGKNTITDLFFKTNNIEFVSNTGDISRLEFIKFVLENRKNIIRCDEFNFNNHINTIKQMLEKPYLVETKTPKLETAEKSFVFEGKILFIMNKIPNIHNEDIQAILSRCLVIELKLDYYEMIKLFFEIIKNPLPNSDIAKVSYGERLEVVIWIRNNTNPSFVLDLRLLNKIFSAYLFKREKWEKISLKYLKCDDEREISYEEIISVLDKSKSVKEAIENWKKEYKLSRVTFFRYTKEFNIKAKQYIKEIKAFQNLIFEGDKK